MHPYINLNAQYGFSNDRFLDYASIEEILCDMDRLGIWQTVVELPMMPNTVYQANQLLRDLGKTSQGQQRVIPCFAIRPSDAFHDGDIEKLKQILRKQQPFCISLYPKTNNHRLRMADLVLDEIEDLCSVILIDRAQLTGEYASDDLVYLARRYPQMHFVVRRLGNNSYAFLFDVMHRASNICVDTSAMHTLRTMELICGRFGEDRVLFSTVPKTYAGASMAAITFAELSEETKNKIRYGNFIGMFREETARKWLAENLKAIPPQVKNRFWRPFVEDGIAPDVEIYDVHCHMGEASWYLSDGDLEHQIPQFEKSMERLHVLKSIATVTGRPDAIQANLDMEAAVGNKKDRLLGYVRYNPIYHWEYTDAYLDDCFTRGYFVGLKTLPQYMGTDIRDPRYDKMFRYAHEHNLPVLIHTWDGNNPGAPWRCAEMALKWPNAKIILGHSGGGKAGRRDCEQIAQDPRYSNVYFEFCGSWAGGLWEDTLQKIDYTRVLYGSDCAPHNMAWEMGRLLSMDIPDEQLTAILSGNAKKLFGF